ncbi:flavin-containing monooxygenase [Cumulibacter soli]|uniref:flavin-containing monooxygenase n=1 Tax=Cumulibacter soli TaxID=2546344 RepID=UPI001ABB16F6|nr:NAD(P)/FAD-dependent oxidoreductase [Cumulibacter soli]
MTMNDRAVNDTTINDSIDAIKTMLGDIPFDPDALRERYRHERDKRLREDGNEQYVEVKAEFSNYVDDPYVDPGFSRAPLTDEVEVAIIGAGFGGLLAGARLREAGFGKIRLIEKGGDVGGTWYWNRYPGAMCDVESYIYLPLLEELGYTPKHKYSFAPEILEHSRNIARHFALYDDATFQTGVTDIVWDEEISRWRIRTDRDDEMRAQYVVMATGPLNRPKLPGIPGINDFQGYTFHTSRWDYSYTGGDSSGNLTGLRDKRVGIIGTGATAIQCVPHLGAWAKELFVFQRTPSSVDVRGNRETDTEWWNSLPPGWQRERMRNFNSLVTGGREEVDLVGDGWTEIFRGLTGIAAKRASERLGRRLTPVEKQHLMEVSDFRKMEGIRSRVDDVVRDPATAQALKPWYRQFCKRPCFHDEYLDTYNRSNVHLIDTDGKGVERLTGQGVVVDGVEYPVDCLIFATGFEVGTGYTRRSGYDVTGRGGITLSAKWADGAKTYHGLQSRGFPNMFFLGLVHTASTVNVPHALSEQVNHLRYIVTEARARGEQVVDVSEQAEQWWCQEIIDKATMAEDFYRECTPGYYNNEGQPSRFSGLGDGRYGAGPVPFFKMLEDWRARGDLPGLELS